MRPLFDVTSRCYFNKHNSSFESKEIKAYRYVQTCVHHLFCNAGLKSVDVELQIKINKIKGNLKNLKLLVSNLIGRLDLHIYSFQKLNTEKIK